MTSSSWYRRSVFGMKGNREYTKAGFEHASLRFGEKDLDVDCSDRHFMITGGNSGIGLATATEIAKRGGILHLVCRNATSMKEARSHIITTTGNDRIYQHQVNLAKPAEVAKWAKDFTETHGHLDVLIHNAGLLVHEREVDDDNIETMFAVHSLAVHLITLILLPVLRRSNDPRVIIVSSAGMLTVKLDSSDLNFEKMNPFNGSIAYSQTKRQQVVMNFSYAQRYDKVKFFSMHPGWVDTPGVKKGLPDFYEQTKDKLRTPEQGADTIIWLAISQAALKHSSGLFFQDRVPVATHLPLAWTRTSTTEEQQFMTILDRLFVQYSSLDPTEIPKFSGHPDRIEMSSEHQSDLHRPSEDESEEPERSDSQEPERSDSQKSERSDSQEPERGLNTSPYIEVEGKVEEVAVIINEGLTEEKMSENDKTESSELNHESGSIVLTSNDENNLHAENQNESPKNNSLDELIPSVPESALENSTENHFNHDKEEEEEEEEVEEEEEEKEFLQNTDSSSNGQLKNESVKYVIDVSKENTNENVEHTEMNEKQHSPSNENTNEIVEHTETNEKQHSPSSPESTTITLKETPENNIHNELEADSSNAEVVVNKS
ncbi:UNVERIFIED_CONTAM: hypothetical protein RMT77_007230 [Armadillidium vulgare]